MVKRRFSIIALCMAATTANWGVSSLAHAQTATGEFIILHFDFSALRAADRNSIRWRGRNASIDLHIIEAVPQREAGQWRQSTVMTYEFSCDERLSRNVAYATYTIENRRIGQIDTPENWQTVGQTSVVAGLFELACLNRLPSEGLQGIQGRNALLEGYLAVVAEDIQAIDPNENIRRE